MQFIGVESTEYLSSNLVNRGLGLVLSLSASELFCRQKWNHHFDVHNLTGRMMQYGLDESRVILMTGWQNLELNLQHSHRVVMLTNVPLSLLKIHYVGWWSIFCSILFLSCIQQIATEEKNYD